MRNLGKLVFTALLISGLAILSSCNKDEAIVEEEVIVTSISDYLAISNSFSLEAINEITSGDDDGTKSASIADCLTVTIYENEDGEFWPRNWILDWGMENCECITGNFRKGKIHVGLTDSWRNEGSFKEITFEDYYFNDNKLEGVKTILNTGLNDNGNLTFTKKVTDAKLTYTDATSMSWNCEKFSEITEGNETFIFADDVWSVTGSGTGVNLDSKEYTMSITTPLIYKNGCFYPVSGIVEIAVTGEDLKVINYGDGECDNIVTVTIGDVTETVVL